MTKKYLIVIASILISVHCSGQLLIEAGRSYSTAFNYQKDASSKMPNGETIRSFLGKDNTTSYLHIGIGYMFTHAEREHSIILNYNRTGLGGRFRVHVLDYPFTREVYGSIEIGHFKENGYNIDSTTYDLGVYYENVGLRYQTSVVKKPKYIISPIIQLDVSWNRRHTIVSTNNNPVVRSSGGFNDTAIEADLALFHLRIGLEAELKLFQKLSAFGYVLQSINSSTKKGDIFSNNSYISTFGLGVRFYR